MCVVGGGVELGQIIRDRGKIVTFKQCEMDMCLLLDTNMKSYMRRPTAQLYLTLNDLEMSNSRSLIF